MKKEIKRILYIGLILNITLTSLKLIFGYLGNAGSLVDDGYNSLADILISISLMVMIQLSLKKPDKDHPYGHEKYEGIVSLVLSLIMLLTAGFIIFAGVRNLITYNETQSYVKPAVYTIYIAAISILIKSFLYIISMIGYKKHKQISLKADAYNHLGDIFSTASSLLGILLSLIGYIYFDYLASIIIGLIILYNATKVFKEAISFLVDEAPSKEYNQKVKETIKTVLGVITIDDYKARKHMDKVYIDVEIGVDANLSLIKAHEIAEKVHQKIENDYEDVIHCMVHVNPKK